jgi:carbamate kinase
MVAGLERLRTSLPDDPGFKNPTKGIGGFTVEDKARESENGGWQVTTDAGQGWRRMIPSPIPLCIIELDAIRTLVDSGFVVVAVGGRGIPIYRFPICQHKEVELCRTR